MNREGAASARGVNHMRSGGTDSTAAGAIIALSEKTAPP